LNLARIIRLEIQQVKTTKGALKESVTKKMLVGAHESPELYKIVKEKNDKINIVIEICCHDNRLDFCRSRSEQKEINKIFNIYGYLWKK
jgi:hypothetical protein